MEISDPASKPGAGWNHAVLLYDEDSVTPVTARL